MNNEIFVNQNSIKSNSIEIKQINSIIKSDIPLNTLYKILVNNPALVNSIDKNGETILSNAIRKNKEDIFKLIMTSPILETEYFDRSGNSYLSIAVLYEREKMIFPLIEKGIPINMINNDGNSALHIAYMINNKKIIQKLIKSKIDINIKNNQGKIAKDFLENYADLKENDIINNDKNDNNNFNNNINEHNNLNLSLANIGLNLLKSQRNKREKRKKIIQMEETAANSIQKTTSMYYNNTQEVESIVKDNSVVNDDIFDMSSLEIIKKKNNDKVVIDNININNENEDKNINDDDNFDYINYNSNINNNYMFDDDDIINIQSNDLNKNKKRSKSQFNIFRKVNELYDIKKSIDKEENEKENEFEKQNELENENQNDNQNQIEQNNIIAINEFEFIEENPIVRKSKTNINKNPINYSNDNINIIDSDNEIDKKDLFSHMKTNDSIKANFSIEEFLKDKEQKNANFKNALNTLQINRMNSNKKLNNDNINENKKEKNNLLLFLSNIGLEKYYSNFNNNGFDDIQLIIAQTKKGLGISDKNLKQIGIKLPGDRARILIKIQELAKNFQFNLPKGVFYIIKEINNNKIKEDKYILQLKNWLKGIKLENYLENFINAGYYSTDLLLIQMESKQPLNNETIEKEFFIEKVGHIERIMNKLKEDSKSLINKLKTTMLIYENGNDKNCECFIF